MDLSAVNPVPLSFHPEYAREVIMVVFEVEGLCFKVDSSRLAMHSEFLRNMLFQDFHIGTLKEGTVDKPIVLKGCAQESFANFLGWLNHFPWEPLGMGCLKQVLDILHISHMWDIRPGIDFACQRLLNDFDLHPANRIWLARKYHLLTWVPAAVRQLLLTPIQDYTPENVDHLGFETYVVVVNTKQEIESARKRLGSYPAAPNNFDNGPYCSHHNICMKVWQERWFSCIARKIHHQTDPIPMADLPKELDNIEHPGMSPACKTYLIAWLRDTCPALQTEEGFILNAISTICQL